MLHLKYLKKLNLSRNNIEVLWELPKNIEQLNVSENLLKSVEEVVRSLSRLHALDISNNQIKDIKPLAQLAHLQCLYARENQIQTLLGLIHFPSLIEIDLESNLISYNDIEELVQNPSLCAVNLRNNPLMR